MKKWIALFAAVNVIGFSTAFAQEPVQEEGQEVFLMEDVATPMVVDCSSKYRGNDQDCWSSTNQCPPGYTGTAQRCYDGRKHRAYRCGTMCESIYKGH
jgi:hypothetical protein